MATTNLPQSIDIDDHLQGDTFPGLEFTITRNSVAKDLTGSAITMTFLLRNRSTSAEQVFTLGSGLTITDGPNGVFEMDQIDVLTWEAGDYYYEVQIIYADGEVKTPVKGKFKIEADKINNS